MFRQNFYGTNVILHKKSILILCGPGFGDTFLSTVRIPELAWKFHDHQIVVCTGTPALADVYSHNPYVHVISLPFVQSSLQSTRHFVAAALKNVGDWARKQGVKVIYPVMNHFFPARSCIDKYNSYYTQLLQYDRRDFLTVNTYFSGHERQRAKGFIEKLPRPIILIEGYTHTGQSPLVPNKLQELLKLILLHIGNGTILLISPRDVPPILTDDRIHYVNVFMPRETCLLYNYSDMFISSASGTSHACACVESNKNVPWLEWVYTKWLSTTGYKHNDKTICMDPDKEVFYKLVLKTLCRMNYST